MADYLDLPLFSMFSYYNNYLAYGKNGLYYSTSGPDEDFDVNMPNWEASAQVTDTTVALVGNNSDVDYYSIRLHKQVFEDNINQWMNWNFSVFGEDGSAKILPRLELPAMITEAIGETFFQTTNDLELNSVSAVDYGKYNSYDETIGWFAFNENAPDGSDNKQRQLGFPISNSSGKSNAANRPLDLDALHRYGFDKNGQVKRH